MVSSCIIIGKIGQAVVNSVNEEENMILIWGYVIHIIATFKYGAIYTLLLFTKDISNHIGGVKKEKVYQR